MVKVDTGQIIAHTPSAAGVPPTSPQIAGLVQTIRSKITKKVLVLDIDETLVHSGFVQSAPDDHCFNLRVGGTTYPIFIRKRPGVEIFLACVFSMFDVFFFTASVREYALAIAKYIAPNIPPERVLDRSMCTVTAGVFAKDLRVFSDDLGSVCIVDNSPTSYCLQPDNGIPVSTWTGSRSDNELLGRILPILQHCVQAEDVRSVIQFFYPKVTPSN